MIRVVVADDQPVVRHGFAAILAAAADVEVVATAADGQELVAAVAEHAPDVAVVDIRMPVMDGLAATRIITAEHPATRVLVLTTFDLDDYVEEALLAGAGGFLLKDVPAERLVEGVRAVADGSMLLGPNVTRRLALDLAARGTRAGSRVPAALPADVTPREREVLGAVARGLSNAEIAAELVIGEETVKSHVGSLLRKTGRRDRVQLVVLAYEAGVVGLD